MERETFNLRPYTHKELAAMYGVSWNTFQKWISPLRDEIGKKHGNYYSARQVRVIVQHLDAPHKMEL